RVRTLTSPLFPYTTLFRSARALPIPGLKENAIALKRIEEAVALRDHFLSRLADASLMEDDEERRKALTFVFDQRSIGQTGEEVRSEEHTSELQSRFDLVCR